MELDKMKTGIRLKKFLYENFASLEEAAEYLGTTTGSLRNSYFNGKSLPGAEIIARVQRKGCDINWLFYGRSQGEVLPEPVKLEYRLEASIPAGKGDIVDFTDWWQSEVIDFKPEDHVFLKIDEQFGYSMMPLISPGDVVLISFSQKPKDGDIVAARWDESRGAIKILNEPPGQPNLIVLTSYNQAVSPIFLNRSKARLYKVVLIKKKK